MKVTFELPKGQPTPTMQAFIDFIERERKALRERGPYAELFKVDP